MAVCTADATPMTDASKDPFDHRPPPRPGFPDGYRPAARAVVLDARDRIMLVRFEFPGRTVWSTPGGGVEPHETVEDGLRRELSEELGLVDIEIGPHLWTRTVTIEGGMGRWVGQCEVVHLVRTEAFHPAPALTWEQLRAEFVHELRWWTLDELAQASTTHLFAPLVLASVVHDVVHNGPPADPHHFDR